jgi:3'-phosphoadenosine 5'-phosphosulfate (PAPS) 3'-phosphatase
MLLSDNIQDVCAWIDLGARSSTRGSSTSSSRTWVLDPIDGTKGANLTMLH